MTADGARSAWSTRHDRAPADPDLREGKPGRDSALRPAGLDPEEYAFRVEVPKGTLTLVTIPEPLWTRAQVAEWLVFWHEAANDDLFMYELPAAANADFANAVLTLGRDLALPAESLTAIAEGIGTNVRPRDEILPDTAGWQPASRNAIGEIIGVVADNSINLPDCRTFCVARAPAEPEPDDAARRRPPFRVDDDTDRPRAYAADIVDRAVFEACRCRDGGCNITNCDDGNPCTRDRCVDGSCTHVSRTGRCPDDGDPCTDDVCSGRACTHPPISGPICQDDDNPCTDDVCLAGACTHPPNTGAQCTDDGDACTTDLCENGYCVHDPIDCETDADPCTASAWCDSYAGCVYVWPCDDGDPCTVDTCTKGGCEHENMFPDPEPPVVECAVRGCSAAVGLGSPYMIKLNDDDDNDNGVADFEEQGPVDFENDLLQITADAPDTKDCPPTDEGCGKSSTDVDWHVCERGGNVHYNAYDDARKTASVGHEDPQPWPPIGFVYLEGILPTTECGVPVYLWVNYGACCWTRGFIELPVVHVKSLEWHVADPVNAPLSRCPVNGGQRMFPGKISPDDPETNTRRRIQLVATIEPPIAGVWVRFRNFDVDDPFDQVYGPNGTQGPLADVGLIDNNTVGNDNRFSQLGVFGTHSAMTDEYGKAVDEFTVTVQPGNNYRAAASVIEDALDQIDQADADALSVKLDAAGRYRPNGDWSGYQVPVTWSKMLTVWRKLHVETDSMVRPTFTQNTYPTDWTNPSQGDTPDRVEVQVDDPNFAFDTADAQFDEGWIELSGTAGTVVGHVFEYDSSAGWDEVIVTVTAANGLNGQRGLAGLGGMAGGSCVLSDDDLQDEATFKARVWGCDDGYAAGNVLAPPDVSALELRYAPAYILPVHESVVSGTGGIGTFLQNVSFGFWGDYGKALWDQAKAPTIRHLPVATPEYWTVMVVSAWQAEEGKDGDPNTETLTNGISTHNNGATTSSLGSSYTGLCAIFKALMIGESDIPEKYTVAHEIAHTLGAPHTSSGLMFPAETVGAPAQQSEPFSADSLVKLRRYTGP